MSQDNYDDDEPQIVVIRHEGVFGIVVDLGPHVSTVVYCVGGLLYEEIMENEDFYFWEDEE